MTTLPFGDAVAMDRQSLGLFAATFNRKTNINKLAGKFPDAADAESKLRMQTSADYPVVRCMDLTRMAGEQISFDFVNPINMIPFVGAEYAEGKGVKMKLVNDEARVNQVRFPIDAGDSGSQRRTVHNLRRLARAQGDGLMARYCDQASLIHLAGARGFHNNQEWVVPLASHAKFASMMINEVKAPTYNRHYMANGNYVETFAASGSEVTLATTDTMNYSLMDHMDAIIEESALPISPCKFEGDTMANDEPLRVWLVSPLQYNAFLNTTNFRTFQSNALTRANAASKSDLFRGNVGIWRNFLVIKMPKPIRFYSGDPIYHATSATSATEITTDLVPAAFASSGYAVDRSLILGAQALVEVLGKSKNSARSLFVSEKKLDHDDKEEILVGIVNGFEKPRFSVDFGADGVQPTDHGVYAVDTVVKL
jgi:N4-gp56 family major capsid protein